MSLVKYSPLRAFIWVLFVLFLGTSVSRAQSNVVPDDVEFAALKALYDNLAGVSWTNKTNWPTTWPTTATSAQFGTWYGVTVSNGDITALTLNQNNLSGTFPAEVTNLTKLTNLSLQSNNISGTLPATLGNLVNLTTLYLSVNKFSGSIPLSIGDLTKLVTISLYGNQFTGPIPSSLNNLTNAVTLHVNDNLFTGDIPNLGSLTKLTSLSISNHPNLNPGPFPSWVSSLTSLTTLSLTNINLTGNIPKEIGNLTNLTSLNLQANQLFGSVPSEIGNLTKLTGLFLNANQLSGSLPGSIGNLVNLTYLYVHTNQFTGNLPQTLNSLVKLQYFLAQSNQFSGTVPSLPNCTQLAAFYINNNNFSGSLPDNFFSTWAKLALLSINTNNFSGPFPSSISNCPLLSYFRGDYNKFTSLPSGLLNLPALSSLNFDYNEISSVPNFANQVNKANLTIRLTYNFLDFSQIEPWIGVGIYSVSYAPQKNINDVPAQQFTIGGDLVLTARPKGSFTNNIVWEKLPMNSSTWQVITSSNGDPVTGTTYRVVGTTAATEGKYRWSCTSTKAAVLNLASESIEVKPAGRFTLDNFSFQYQYDARKRMTAKRVPGADWVYMVYDDRDRLVLTQDGEQRKLNRWTFTKYDELNRPVMTGIKDTAAVLSQAEMQGVVNTYYSLIKTTKPWRKFGEKCVGAAATGNVHGYSNASYPQVTTGTVLDANSYLTVTYYDNYTFRNDWAGAYAYINDGLKETVNSVLYEQPVSENQKVVGQVTGTKVKALDGIGYTWLRSINYYDDKYRVVQTQADNYKGGIDRISNLIDFIGKILKTKTTHVVSQVSWKNIVGAKVESNALVRSAAGATWGGSGASSNQILSAGADGWVEFTVSETSTNRFLGLSDVDSDQDKSSIDFAIYQQQTNYYIYENGVWKFVIYEPNNPNANSKKVKPGDLMRIERVGGIVKYYWNGILLYTSGTTSATQLVVDASLYNFGGTLVNVKSSFGNTSIGVNRTFDYDHAGRLLRTWHQIDEGTKYLLSKNEYNELGQLVDKKLHSTAPDGSDAKQSVDYRYNIRGWLTSINNASLVNDDSNDDSNDYFGMNLAYNADLGIGNEALFNGNISGVTWSNNQGLGEVKRNAYTYSYDPMNRIKTSVYKEDNGSWASRSNGAFAETDFQYDLNGNIKKLTRNDGRTSGIMDILTYNYGTGLLQSNRLLSVSDSGDKFTGFIDDPFGNTMNDYTYDANGNLTRDLNKGIGTTLTDATNIITYNYLNLPETVTKGGNSIRYIYDATGRKLSQRVSSGANFVQTDYVGEFQYENDLLKFVNHEEGRVVMSSPKMISFNDGDDLTGITTTNANLSLVTLNKETYIKVTSKGTVVRTGISSIKPGIPVQAGERYRIRVKGYRTGSYAANVLVKVSGNDLNWPGVALPPSSTMESWVEQIVSIPVSGSLEVGVVWPTVINAEVLYVNEFDIIKLDASAPEYQYTLKDHLGNVRVTFTSKDETISTTATLESDASAQEQGEYLNYGEAIIVNAAIFDHTNGTGPYHGGWEPPDPDYVDLAGRSTRLTGIAGERIGLAKSLSVAPGDKIDVEVFVKYLGSQNVSQELSDFILSIAAGGTAPTGTIVDGGLTGSIGTAQYPQLAALVRENDNGTGPKAYLNYLVFDKDYNYKEGGFRRVTEYAMETGNNGPHERLAFDGTDQIKIKEAGYVYIWISNENETPVEVYFDDFKVDVIKSPVIQMDDYYPFGLTFNSYNRENTTPNQYKFSGKEIQDELSLNWYDFGNRMYNSEIGRWNRIDDFSDKYHPVSPYNYALNNPLKYVDPTGDSVIRVNINDRSGYIHGATTVYIDHTIFDDLVGILNAAVTTGTHIKINSSFRTNKKQAELKESKDAITPASPGNSPHNAGVGIDFSLYENNDVSQGRIKSNSTVTSDNAFIKAVKGFDGWRWGGDFSTPDKVHIDRRPGETEFAKIRDANQSQMHGDDEVGNLDKYVTRVENVAVGITKYQRWLNNPRDRNAAREALDELRQDFSAIKGNLQQLKQQIKQASGNK